MQLFDNFVPAFNGDTSGAVAPGVMADPNFLHYRRPYLPESGPNANVPCVTVNTGRYTTEKGEKKPIREQHRIMDLLNKGYQVPVWTLNATSFRRDDWIQIDREVQAAYRNRLKLIADLQSRVQVSGFNGWSKLTYEYDAMSDAHTAVVDMDGLSEGPNDAPLFLPRSVPLPFTHSDFFYSDRVLAASRANGNTGLDVYSAEQAARRVAEKIEDTAIGITTGMTYGGRSNYFAHNLASTVFGLTNYTNRNTKTNFTTPTTSNGPTSYAEFLAAFETLYGDNVYGPYAIYHSTDWSQYMNSPFSTAGGNHPSETLRSMLLKHPDVASVERLDRLTSTFTVLIVELNRRTVRFLNGMDVTTYQWDTRGGMQKNFKVGVVQSLLCLSDYTGKCGILHGTTS